MKRILRVFPQRTSYTPDDDMALIGAPPFDYMIPQHDEVHISCIFSWDKKYCLDLQEQWRIATDKPVLVGGPAFESPVCGFTKGLYVKNGVTFTSRGCNNNCPWCIVPKLEGKLKELPIVEGNIIQDNNFLQTSEAHKQKVYEMLKTQKGICFKGGLEADLITNKFAEDISQLSIKELWLACDTDAHLPILRKATAILQKHGFNRNKIRCYALIGDDMAKNEARLQAIYEAGAMPFAQLYQPIGGEEKKESSHEWKLFHRMWSRPAAIKAHIEKDVKLEDMRV